MCQVLQALIYTQYCRVIWIYFEILKTASRWVMDADSIPEFESILVFLDISKKLNS